MTIERLADWLANTNPGFFILAAAGVTAIGCLLLFVGAEYIADYLEPLGNFTLMEVAP